VRLVRVRGIAAVRRRHPRADAAHGFIGRLLRRKRPRPGGAGGSRGPGSGAASAERTHRGLGYLRLNEAAEEDETLEALDQFEVEPPSLSPLRAWEPCALPRPTRAPLKSCRWASACLASPPAP
jgi:hypothetical protein